MRNPGAWMLLALLGVGTIFGAATATKWFALNCYVDFESRSPERRVLMERFETYSSVPDVAVALDRDKLKYKLKKSPRRRDASWRPPFHLDTIIVQEFRHLDGMGRLAIIFFNDRLYSLRYFPRNAKSYRGRFLEEYGVDIAADTGHSIQEHVRVWRAMDHRKREYIGWEDVRLSREVALWIKRYSSQAPASSLTAQHQKENRGGMGYVGACVGASSERCRVAQG